MVLCILIQGQRAGHGASGQHVELWSGMGGHGAVGQEIWLWGSREGFVAEEAALMVWPFPTALYPIKPTPITRTSFTP